MAGTKKLNLIVIGIVAIVFAVILYQGVRMDYSVSGDSVHISWFKGVNISRRDIKDVVILEDRPNMSKVVGVDLFNIRAGTYQLEGIGNVRMYAGDIKRKLVLVKTDGTTYCITPKDPEKFKSMLGY